MSDPRHFAKMDLGYFENPKIAEFMDERPRVPILHMRAILYARGHLTDGKFPIRTVSRLAYADYCGSQCESQCESQCDFCAAHHAGLFERIDDRTGLVHDYLEHQDSAEQVNARKSAGQAGAAARWGLKSGANGNADRIAKGNADANAEKRREEKSVSTRRKAESTLPADWQPNDKHRTYASSKNLDLEREAFRFRNHATANDRRQRDWNAAFTNWLDKAFPAPPSRSNRGQMPEGW